MNHFILLLERELARMWETLGHLNQRISMKWYSLANETAVQIRAHLPPESPSPPDLKPVGLEGRIAKGILISVYTDGSIPMAFLVLNPVLLKLSFDTTWKNPIKENCWQRPDPDESPAELVRIPTIASLTGIHE